MAASTLVRKAMLSITADDAEAQEKLDAIKEKADALREANPELVPVIDNAEAMAKLKVLKDEIRDAAVTADETPIAPMADIDPAKAKIAELKADLDRLRLEKQGITVAVDAGPAEMEIARLQAQLAKLRGEQTAAADESAALATETGALGKEAGAATVESEGLAKAWDAAKWALLGLAGGIGFGIYKAAGFTQQMLLLHTQAGVTTGVMNQMSTGVLKLAGQVGQGPDSLAEAAYHVASNMASMGATTKQMLGAVKVAAEGAAVGQADLVDVTNALGAAIASGIPGVKNYQSAMGEMNATVGAGDMTMQDLADAFGHGTISNVKLYGSTLTDVGAILATFGDNNLRGAAAGTQLRMSVQAIAVQASTAGPYLKQLGLQVGELGKYQSLHGTVATINLLVGKMKEAGITSTEQGNIITQLFGKKAGAGIGVLIDQIDRLNSKVPLLTKGGKDFNQAWAAQQNTPAQKMKDLEAGSEALAISLGTHLLPVASKVLGWLTSFVNGLESGNGFALTIAGTLGSVLGLIALKKLEDGLSGAVEGVESLWKGGTKLVGWATQFATKLGILKSAQAEATEATEAQTVATEESDAAMDANPIGVIILAIGALIIVIVELVKHWHTVSAVTKEVFHDIEHWVLTGLDWLKAHWPIIIGIFLGPMPFIIAELAQHWRQVLHGVETVYHDVTGWFRRLPGAILSAVGDLGHLLWNAGVDVIKGLIGGVTSMIGQVESTISGIGGDIEGGIKDVLGIFSPSRVMFQHGRMIGEGLALGMEAEFGRVHTAGRQLATTAESGAVSGYGGGSGRAGVLQLEWVGGNPDSALWTLLKRNIRVRGGNPAVLGA